MQFTYENMHALYTKGDQLTIQMNYIWKYIFKYLVAEFFSLKVYTHLLHTTHYIITNKSNK